MFWSNEHYHNISTFSSEKLRSLLKWISLIKVFVYWCSASVNGENREPTRAGNVINSSVQSTTESKPPGLPTGGKKTSTADNVKVSPRWAEARSYLQGTSHFNLLKFAVVKYFTSRNVLGSYGSMNSVINLKLEVIIFYFTSQKCPKKLPFVFIS